MGMEPTSERHFSGDRTACLCSPFDEDEFLQPEFQFSTFLEQLIIPFLYGQIFYDAEGHWPWSEYAHGATGILEAYSEVPDQTKTEECLGMLTKYPSWASIKLTLSQKPYIKGHTPCFCGSGDHFIRCHPKALEGARRLQEHLRAIARFVL
jgi:hypothetical protein